jgi:beta-N-acetylhexosaminidase
LSNPKAVIFGCAGAALSTPERRFFEAADPLGFILFERNCENPDQIRDLVRSLRGCVARPDAPVLIDQEGGRVVRLKPPQWRAIPAMGRIGALAKQNPKAGREAAFAAGRLIAANLAPLGIDVDCAPVLDVPAPGSHGIIGDRAFANDPELVAELGREFCRGLLAGGVLPVLKHIPGHGRAMVDSHADLPVIDLHRQTLALIDFAPFKALRDMPWAMTAHVVYRAYDQDAPATTSAKVIAEVIRGDIGFDGVLISDDLSMGALSGSLASRAKSALEAGCDLALHCNGKLREMEEIASGCGELSKAAQDRVARARSLLHKPEPADIPALAATLGAAMVQSAAMS